MAVSHVKRERRHRAEPAHLGIGERGEGQQLEGCDRVARHQRRAQRTRQFLRRGALRQHRDHTAAVQAQNLTDEVYNIGSTGANNIDPSLPPTVQVSLSLRF